MNFSHKKGIHKLNFCIYPLSTLKSTSKVVCAIIFSLHLPNLRFNTFRLHIMCLILICRLFSFRSAIEFVLIALLFLLFSFLFIHNYHPKNSMCENENYINESEIDFFRTPCYTPSREFETILT